MSNIEPNFHGKIHMRRVELKIVNSRLLVGDDFVEAGVAIEDGKITKVAKEPNLPDSDMTIDARSAVMLPGVVDVHVHMRDMDLCTKRISHLGHKLP